MPKIKWESSKQNKKLIDRDRNKIVNLNVIEFVEQLSVSPRKSGCTIVKNLRIRESANFSK